MVLNDRLLTKESYDAKKAPPGLGRVRVNGGLHMLSIGRIAWGAKIYFLIAAIPLLFLPSAPTWAKGSIAAQEQSRQRNADEDPRVQAILDEYLPKFEQANWGMETHRPLGHFLHELRKLAQSRIYPNNEARTNISRVFIDAYYRLSSSSLDEEIDLSLRRSIAQTLATFGDRRYAMPFLKEMIYTWPNPIRNTAFAYMKSSACIFAEEFYEDIEELHRKGIYDKGERIAYLDLCDPERARPEVIKIAKLSNDPDEFMTAARILQQSGRFEHYRIIYSRALELGLDKDVEAGGIGHRLFWVNENDIARYLNEAEGDDLMIGMTLLEKGGALVNRGGLPIVLKRKLFMHNNPDVRRISISKLRKAVERNLITLDAALELLDELEKKEKVESVRAVITKEKVYLKSKKQGGVRKK